MTEKKYKNLIVLLYVLNKLLDHVHENAYDLTLKYVEIVKDKLKKEKFIISDFDVSDLDKNRVLRNAISGLKDIGKEKPHLEEEIEMLIFILGTKRAKEVLKSEGGLRR